MEFGHAGFLNVLRSEIAGKLDAQRCWFQLRANEMDIENQPNDRAYVLHCNHYFKNFGNVEHRRIPK